MAHSKSAEKRHRQSLKRRDRNRSVMSATRTALRKARSATETAPASAWEAIRDAVSVLDRAAKKGVLPSNSVARRKSRLVARLQAAVAAQAAAPEVEAAPKRPARKARAATKARAPKAPARAAAEEKKAPARGRLRLGRKKTEEK